MRVRSYFQSKNNDFVLLHGDVRTVLHDRKGLCADMIFADPPYFLSNGGFSVRGGQCVSVNKGDWDKSRGFKGDQEFNREWIKACRDRMSDSATIWICGTFHNIFSVANQLTELGFRILNAITWQKTNPPPNLSCRFFTHSTEIIVWARKSKTVPHYYNYDLMHKLAGDRQMTDVGRMPASAPWEKTCGKHPTQKPLALVTRAILASTQEGALILDPFTGSSTTGIAANLLKRRFVGVDNEKKFLDMSIKRFKQIPKFGVEWMRKIPDIGGGAN